MAGDRAAEFGASTQAEAIRGGVPSAKLTGADSRLIQRVRVIARRVDVALPGDHVVEAGAEPGIAGPQDAVLGGAEAVGRRALVALRAVRHGAGVGGQQCG